MNWQDISQTLYDGMTVWPGDAPFKYQKTADISQGQGANVGAIQTSLHAGTHIDAPYHIKGNGSTIDQLPLDDFIGPVQIIEVNHEKTLTLDFINQHLSSETKRLFIKTQTRQPIKIAENLANHFKK